MAKHIHFLGIGGSGASAIAAIAESQGFKVTGCDKFPHNEFTKVFDKRQLFTGHSLSHLGGGLDRTPGDTTDILAVTPAIFSLDPNNEELREASNRGIRVMTWQQFMGKFLEKDKFVIAVCGTHGKSTTTAMIGLLLEEAGLDPTVELGAIVPKWGTNYRIGKSKYISAKREDSKTYKGIFITEADEFNDNFLATHPDITVVTTIEMDHPEYFKDFSAVKDSFKKFLGQAKDKIIANLSDKGICDVLASPSDAWETKTIGYQGKLIDFPLQIPGRHNILNASAVYQVGLALGIDPQIIKKSLMDFTGIGRRFEYLGESGGVKVYSDFAHHPTEIKVTMEAAREKFPDKKIIMVFQPHMFSRTHVLFNEFVKVLSELPVDQIYILDIYPSREVDTGLVNSKQLVEAVGKNNVSYLEKNEQTLEELIQKDQKYDIIFFVGAGDIDKLARQIAEDHI